MDPKTKEILERLEKDGIILRSAPVKVETLDEKARSIEGVFSDETAVDVWDWGRGEIIKEVLLADGYEFGDQIPFLDSHNRSSVKDQLGSARGMAVKNGALVGRVFFGNTPDAEAAYSLAKEGHIRDLSIGYRQLQYVDVPEGQTYKHKDGREFAGPLRVTLRTLVKEVSLTPIGANSFSKLRSAPEANDELIRLRDENKNFKDVIRLLTIK